jgi:hypothetical protein
MQNGMLLKVEEKLSFWVLQKNVGYLFRAKKILFGEKLSPIKVKRPVHCIVKQIFVTEIE